MRNTRSKKELAGTAKNITDEEIKTAIREYAERKCFLAENLKRIRRDLTELEGDLYATVAMPESGFTEERSEGHREDPMVPMILRKERELRQYRREFLERIAALEEENLRLDRIHMAYRLLPWRQQRVLEKLYQDRRPWKGLAEELGMTKTTLVRLRAEAFDGIREICSRVERAAQTSEPAPEECCAVAESTVYGPEECCAVAGTPVHEPAACDGATDS